MPGKRNFGVRVPALARVGLRDQQNSWATRLVGE